jgi:serine/threonine protein kinase
MEHLCRVGISADQREIIADRLNGVSYAALIQKYEILRSNACITKCLKRTVMGLPYPAGKGGRKPYLGKEDAERLKEQVKERQDIICPMTVVDLMEAAQALRQHRYDEAVKCLCSTHSLGCVAGLGPVEVIPPSRPWVNSFAQKCALVLKYLPQIDLNRLTGATIQKISAFFDEFENVIPQYPPQMIFGADETMVDLHRVYKHVVTEGGGQVVSAEKELPHISGMMAHSCGGARVPPFVIVPKLQNPTPDLIDIVQNQQAWLVSSPKGWQIRDTFFLWAVHFCHWSTSYRSKLPDPLMRMGKILLILDGHVSRACPAALDLFRLFKIDVLILPAHTSHVLQMFDIGIAASLKRLLAVFYREGQKLDFHEHNADIARLRHSAISALIKAWESCASPDVCRQAAKSAGMVPCDRTKVLGNDYVIDGNVPWLREMENRQRRETLNINSRMITDPGVIEEIRNHVSELNPDSPLLQFGQGDSYVAELFKLVNRLSCKMFSRWPEFVNMPHLKILAGRDCCDVEKEFEEIRISQRLRSVINVAMDPNLFIFLRPAEPLPAAFIARIHIGRLYVASKFVDGDKNYCFKLLRSIRLETPCAVQDCDCLIRKLCHLNVDRAERLRHVITQLSSVYLVHDYYPFTLETAIFTLRIQFPVNVLAYVLKTMCEAVNWLAQLGYVHMDLGLNCFLFQTISDIRIGNLCHALTGIDFLKSELPDDISHCPPEFILGARTDWRGYVVWNLGLLFFEVITGTVLFPRGWVSESEQMRRIQDVFGSPNQIVINQWDKLSKGNYNFNTTVERRFDAIVEETFPYGTEELKPIVKGMLELSQRQRINPVAWFATLSVSSDLIHDNIPEMPVPECPSLAFHESINVGRQRDAQ